MIYDVQPAYVSEPVAILAAPHMESAYFQERKYGSVQVEVMMKGCLYRKLFRQRLSRSLKRQLAGDQVGEHQCCRSSAVAMKKIYSKS